jgi:hypothetical protein
LGNLSGRGVKASCLPAGIPLRARCAITTIASFAVITIKATGAQRGGSYHVTRESREVVAIVSIVHPVFGQALLWFLLLVYAACILVPLIAFLRLPRSLPPPSADDQAAQKVFREKLAKRLRSNRNLTQGDVTSETIERHCPS